MIAQHQGQIVIANLMQLGTVNVFRLEVCTFSGGLE